MSSITANPAHSSLAAGQPCSWTSPEVKLPRPGAAAFGTWFSPYLALPLLVAAAFIALSLKMANAWQKFVILRAGKLQSVKGPGLFMIIPV